MSDSLLAIVEYSGYISIIKFAVFTVLFFLWLPLLNWVYADSQNVNTNYTLWTSVTLGSFAAATILFLLIPVFVIGVSLYVLAIAMTAIVYIKHRNNLVMDFDRILTGEHIKSLLFPGQSQKTDELKHFQFITANNNEAPLPEPKSQEFYGYKAAYDIMSDAVWRRAKEITITPTHQDYRVLYNIDGVVVKQPEVDREKIEYFIHFVKNLADLDTREKRKPQKGSFAIRPEAKQTIEWTVITAGSTAGEQIELKHSSSEDVLKLPQIGLMDDQYKQMQGIRDQQQGLFIISGPEKSGVTTSFYAFLQNHDAFLNSIDILEKNPAAELPNVSQNIFSLSDTGTTTYAKRLLRIIRMAPDILGAAECEDHESALVAAKAAADGKIVYVTIEADSVVQAIVKWIKLVGSRDAAIEPLLGVSNQRLLRKLCSECKQAYSPNAGLLRKFNLSSEKVKALYRAGKVIYDKHGKEQPCEKCQSIGFFARTGIFETITMTDKLKDAIKKSKSLSEIDSHLRNAKMMYMQEMAMKKVIDGTTAVNEMIRITTSNKGVK